MINIYPIYSYIDLYKDLGKEMQQLNAARSYHKRL